MGVWQEVINNLAIVAMYIAGWQYIGNWLEERPVCVREAALGAFSGLCAVLIMLVSIELNNGTIFDLRISFFAVAGLFGGPIGAATSVLVAAPVRLLIGGPIMGAGVGFIILAGLMGVVGHYLAKRAKMPSLQILNVSIASVLLVWLAINVQKSMGHYSVSEEHFAFGAVVVFLTTLVLGVAIQHRIARSDTRRLFRAAVDQSPDYQFVKDRQGRYIFANRNVARFLDEGERGNLHGKNNFQARPTQEAWGLDENERMLIRTGTSMVDREEALVCPDGITRMFETSKASVFSDDGRVIGLVGIARDVTEKHRIEAELENQRIMLSYALTEMTDGLALFDENGILMFCNARFQACFPKSGPSFAPGIHRDDMIRTFARNQEGNDLPREITDAEIAEMVDRMHLGAAREVHLPDGHWLRLRARKTAEGKVVLMVSDITETKLTQEAMLTLTDQLKALAMTDGMTGLKNRRTFDEVLEQELRRTERAGLPISLLLMDVDHFKSFNDLYGHLAGDDCLRAVGSSVKEFARRPGDFAARFGGEEFVIILPNTDQAAAIEIAERLNRYVADLSLTHEDTQTGFVTMSIGVAGYRAGETGRKGATLIQRADEALYQAKDEGRDRVVAWRKTCELGRVAS